MKLTAAIVIAFLFQQLTALGGPLAEESGPPRDELLIQAARNAALAGNELLAIHRIRQYLALRPDDGQAALELASMLRRTQQPNEANHVCRAAIKHLRDAHDADPAIPERLLQLARLHRWIKEYTEADDAYSQYVAMVPNSRQARLEQARLAGWDFRYDDAEQYYQALERRFPEDRAIAVEHQAKKLNWGQRPLKAAEEYERALELQPDDPELLFDLAQMHSRRGFSQRAEQLYDRILTLIPDHSMAAQAKEAESWRLQPRVTIDQVIYDREGRDGTVDIQLFRTDFRLSPARLAEATDVSIGVGQSFFSFDRKPVISAEPSTLERVLTTFGLEGAANLVAAYKQMPERRRLQRFDAHSPATHFTLTGERLFYSGLHLQGELELTGYDQHPHSTLQFSTSASYRIEDELELALLAGREDVLENFLTIDDGLSRNYLGGRFDWDPVAWLRVSGRTRWHVYDEGNRAVEFRLGPDLTILPYPHMLTLRSRFQGLHFAAEKPEYWTPRDYWNAQAGLTWRHYLGDRHFSGAEQFCYYIDFDAGIDDQHEPQMQGKVGVQWDSRREWKLGIEVSATQSDVYSERRLLITLSRAW